MDLTNAITKLSSNQTAQWLLYEIQNLDRYSRGIATDLDDIEIPTNRPHTMVDTLENLLGVLCDILDIQDPLNEDPDFFYHLIRIDLTKITNPIFKTNTTMKTHKSQLEALLKDHYPELAHIQITDVKLYYFDDLPFLETNPSFKPTWFEDDNSIDEPMGIKIQFFSEQPIPITALANLCNILCYGNHWAIDPEYGDIDPSELPRKQDLDTCWHHSQISKLRNTKGFFYTIEQEFCTCS